jgi:hypothetical protein
MGEKIIIGPFNKGLRNDRIPAYIDNDSFPTLINAYQWRGRIKRKRGTSFLTQLQRFFNSTSTSYNSGSTTITLDVGGNGNLLTGFSLQVGAIVPGSVTITDTITTTAYTDPAMNGNLSPSGTINYATGAIQIAAAAGDTVTASFLYTPELPVMGLEDLVSPTLTYPGVIAFDTKYSYYIPNTTPFTSYDVSFYKNPPTGTYPGYIAKTNPTPTTWNGTNYQQFWTTNYQGALWATNGATEPFTTPTVGMQFKPIVAVTVTSGGPPAIVNLQITGHGLVQGDFLFINEVVTTTGINYQTGYVTTVVNANNVTVEFPNATITTNGTGGIAQYLTNIALPGVDSLRWYDGDPTNMNATNPVLNGHLGWVNFAPPLSQSNFSIGDAPASVYYLVGAKLIFPFKDRLIFFGPIIENSSKSIIYLQDTIIYSQNGTPFYTASYTNTPSATVDTPTNPTTVFNPILVPVNQTATSPAYFEDSTGFGGFLTAGVDQEITTVGRNEDVLIVGFTTLQSRLFYTGNDVLPFNFFIVNSELGSGSTFSAITMDKGIISRGNRGLIITSQVEASRIDIDIPDEAFQLQLINNGAQRVCAQRDFINEWIYFTYPTNFINYVFPTITLQYNYRENTWAKFLECYTTYGTFRQQTGFTWATVGETFPTWNEWDEPWNAGASTTLEPKVIAGNQQGFVSIRDEGTGEQQSLAINNIVGNLVTSNNHCLNTGDYIIITGCLGTVGQVVNSQIFQVNVQSINTFLLSPILSSGFTYLGNGFITRLYIPFVQSKQFPVAWETARKTRLGPQQYLLSTTSNGQITLLIFLSQDPDTEYNSGPIIPQDDSTNDSLIYSTILYTCPESTNLGLTPANVNLQMPTAFTQNRIWHRINTSLLGDTVQVGFTLSPTQMTTYSNNGLPLTITNITQANPCVITCANTLNPGQLVFIAGVVGMTQINFDPELPNYYSVLSATGTSVTLNLNSTAFSAYISGGQLQVVFPQYQFAEIEIHGIILDVQPSSMLA